MGNSASKAARKFPVRASAPKFSPPPSQQQQAQAAAPSDHEAAVQRSTRLAESHRSEAIEQDAGDPDFLANLSRLGQVRVDHHMQSIRPDASNNTTTRLFESRAKAEAEAAAAAAGMAQPVRNQLYAFVLSDLLDRRKAVRSRAELEALAAEYNMDVGKLESLGRFVNSVSINSASIRPVAGKSEEDGFMATAVWLEPKLN